MTRASVEEGVATVLECEGMNYTQLRGKCGHQIGVTGGLVNKRHDRLEDTSDALLIQTYPGATVLLQPTLLLDMHAKDRCTDQIAANQTKGGVDPA